MKYELIDEQKLLNGLSGEWKTSAQLRQELGLTAGPKKIGQALRKIRKENANIETVSRGRILLYRIKGSGIRNAIITEVQAPVKADITKELDRLIRDLKSQGVNVQEICYLALRDTKERLESELRELSKVAPTFINEYRNLQDEVRIMKNTLQDYKDKIDRIEAQNAVKLFADDRKARAGVISG